MLQKLRDGSPQSVDLFSGSHLLQNLEFFTRIKIDQERSDRCLLVNLVPPSSSEPQAPGLLTSNSSYDVLCFEASCFLKVSAGKANSRANFACTVAKDSPFGGIGWAIPQRKRHT